MSETGVLSVVAMPVSITTSVSAVTSGCLYYHECFVMGRVPLVRLRKRNSTSVRFSALKIYVRPNRESVPQRLLEGCSSVMVGMGLSLADDTAGTYEAHAVFFARRGGGEAAGRGEGGLKK